MTYSLHHVHLICRDLEKMIAFFKGPENITIELVQPLE
jgi:catechol 2,3-dioxygenase-like lactoylglutathione lyase family enzyme